MWSAFRNHVPIVNPWPTGWQWEQGPWKGFPHVHVSDVLCYKPIPIIDCSPYISLFHWVLSVTVMSTDVSQVSVATFFLTFFIKTLQVLQKMLPVRICSFHLNTNNFIVSNKETITLLSPKNFELVKSFSIDVNLTDNNSASSGSLSNWLKFWSSAA